MKYDKGDISSQQLYEIASRISKLLLDTPIKNMAMEIVITRIA
jgi:hypothetical protein